tara:strand:- start:152 stop:400 length:249 start_codon:yes stop_codon:yes gene_type:complete
MRRLSTTIIKDDDDDDDEYENKKLLINENIMDDLRNIISKFPLPPNDIPCKPSAVSVVSNVASNAASNIYNILGKWSHNNNI